MLAPCAFYARPRNTRVAEGDLNDAQGTGKPKQARWKRVAARHPSSLTNKHLTALLDMERYPIVRLIAINLFGII